MGAHAGGSGRFVSGLSDLHHRAVRRVDAEELESHTQTHLGSPTVIFIDRSSCRWSSETFYMDPSEFCFNLNMDQAKLHTIQ